MTKGKDPIFRVSKEKKEKAKSEKEECYKKMSVEGPIFPRPAIT